MARVQPPRRLTLVAGAAVIAAGALAWAQGAPRPVLHEDLPAPDSGDSPLVGDSPRAGQNPAGFASGGNRTRPGSAIASASRRAYSAW